MARNFVILYCGREGSSAITKAFSNRSDVRIPVFEDFDQYARADTAEDDVPMILDHMLATGQFSTKISDGAARSTEPTLPSPPAIGFKWRIWGDAKRLAQVLHQHKVVVFELLRADIVNFALSAYLSEHVLPFEENSRFSRILQDPNPQFRIRWLEADARDEVISFIRARSFSVDAEKLSEIMQAYLGWRALLRDTYIDPFRASGLEVHTLFYEDFLADAADFLGRMAAAVGVPIDPAQRLFYAKVNRPDMRIQVTNLAELESNRDIQRIKLRYYNHLVAKPFGSLSRRKPEPAAV